LTPEQASALYFCSLLLFQLASPSFYYFDSGNDMNAFKQIALRAFILLLLATVAHPSFAQQWKSTNGPFGGQIRCVANAGSTTYVGTYRHGIFQSKDNGATWSPIKVNGTTYDTTVYAITTNGNTVLAGAEGGVALVTTNNGTTWTATPALGDNSHTIRAVAIHGSTFIAAADQDNILVSTDNGATWKQSNSGITTSSVSALAVSGNTIWAAVQHPSDDTALRMSTNDGKTWTKVWTQGMTAQANTLAALNNILVAGTDAGVFLSTDNGAHWASNTNGMDITNISSLASDGATTLFASTLDYSGSGGAVYSYSILSGATGSWTALKNGLTGFGSDKIYGLAYIGTNLFAATDNGLFVSADKGGQWTSSNRGLAAFTVTALKASGNLLVAGTDNFDVHISTDNGATWTHTTSGLVDLIGGTRSNVYDVAIAGNMLFAATDSGVYSSSDNGGHWTLGNNILRDTAVLSLYSNGTILLAGTYTGVFASLNNGQTFANAGNGLTAHSISALAANGTTVYAGSNEGGVFTATAGLAPVWSQVKTGMESASTTAVSAIAVGTTDVFAGTRGNGVFVTSNGTSWTQVSGLPQFLGVVALATNADTLFVASQSQGIFRVAPSGNAWTVTSFGMTDTMVRSLASANSTVYAGTSDYGVMSSPAAIAPAGGNNAVDDADQISFGISSIAPNPANSASTITFSLAEAGTVSLTLFDATGYEVSVVNESVGEGTHLIAFDASKIPAGVYLCRLTANGKSITRNIVIAH
jgi:photosystem II stability/assembly factor-like uncharacterized protein